MVKTALKGIYIYDPVNKYTYVDDTKVSVSLKKLMPTNAHLAIRRYISN